jgi:CubicO group peptidase (beta-lactamase class C family)
MRVRVHGAAAFACSVVVCLAAAAGAARATHAATARPPDRLERAVRALDAERERLHIPGLAIAIVEHDQVVLLRGLGVRDLATKLPVDSLTVFPIGSCTKAFTAMAVLVAQNDGRLTLDDPPRRYLPWFHMDDKEADALITLRDMLSHRTGLLEYADLAAEPGVLTRLEYLRAATAARPVAKFRSSFHYSNAMVVAAGEIVGRVYDTTWEHAIEAHLLQPLGMNSSSASMFDLARFPNRAIGYHDTTGTGTFRATPLPLSLDALAPAGSIVSCARDMARWLRFLLAEGAIDGRRILPRSLAREAFRPHNTITPALSYGLGWAIYEWNGHAVVEHNGGSQGLSALVSFMPDKQTGFVLLANTTPTSLTRVSSAGKMLWPILTGETASAGAPAVVAPPHRPSEANAPKADSPAASDTTNLPSARELLARITEAAGGEANLERHAAMTIRAQRDYLNQGVSSRITVRWAMPNRRVDEEVFSAAGRRIGSVRAYFDGSKGGQETTFGQDAIYSGADLDHAREDAALNWFVDPAGLKLRVTERVPDEGDSVYVLEASNGTEKTLYRVSARTHLVLERTRGSRHDRYSDFRNVDGRILPFHTEIDDDLGESELNVKSVTFADVFSARAFEARAR